MFAVIMCGGSGTRFWPLSRKAKPKQFLNITGRGPMVVETCDRIKSSISDTEMILILGQEHLKEARNLFKGRGVNIVAEPVGRNTAPCIGLGAIYARHLGCKDPVAFLPADHYIGDPSAFVSALTAAGGLAGSGGIVTLGIIPQRPETGYGYIRRGDGPIDAEGAKAYEVMEFVEKPGPDRAVEYLKSGEYYWNAGIFVATPETILSEMKSYLPDLFDGLLSLDRVLGTDSFEIRLKEVYEKISGISFDYGIMEKTKEPVYVVPCECGWSDVGSWSSIYELRSHDHDKDHNLMEGDTLSIESRRNYVCSNSGRTIVCLGVQNCLIVDTQDAVLVADINRSQEIRKIVERLKKGGREELL